MNGVPGALQNRDPACRARQVNSRHFFAISTILTCIFTNGFTNEIFISASILHYIENCFIITAVIIRAGNERGKNVMTFQELLEGKQINWDKVKLVRHNLTNDVVAANYDRGYLNLYQSIQSPTRFRDCDMIASFLGTEGTNGVFQGFYHVGSFKPYNQSQLPEDFVQDDGMIDGSPVIYELTRLDLLSDMKDRIVIDWGKGAINWCQNGTTAKELLEILPAVSEISFTSYNDVLLSYETLHKIVYNKAAYKVWEDRLSAVAGVYLITDTKTGKHYVGSASGKDGGIWQRWSEYAQTKHGGNKFLKELIDADADYCKNFQYSILETFPIKGYPYDVLKSEKLYKQKLLSYYPYGLNDN